jgi:hypothetical protein
MPLPSFDSLFDNLPLMFEESDPFGGSLLLADPVMEFLPQVRLTCFCSKLRS